MSPEMRIAVECAKRMGGSTLVRSWFARKYGCAVRLGRWQGGRTQHTRKKGGTEEGRL